MNYRYVFYQIGFVIWVEAVAFFSSVIVAFWYKENPTPFLVSILITVIAGYLLTIKRPERNNFYAKEGFALVALSWIILSLFGALPFVLSGDIPNYVDAVFETVSGFTTTGASILTDVEAMSQACLWWRSLTHWFGGMGILVFVLAILPSSGGTGMHIMRAEVPGPTKGKLVGRMGDTAKILYVMYISLTVAEIFLLMVGGMSFFDACIHSFGTAGTGGFSNMAASVGAYDSAYIDVVIGTFMLLFGVNFSLYYLILLRKVKDLFKSEELRAYFFIVAASVVAITINIIQIYGNIFTSLRYAYFQVATIITTTGYATADFNLWPSFSKAILVTLMFVGACAGSTGGGIKVARVILLVKIAFTDMRRLLHPNAVTSIRLEGKVLSDKNIRDMNGYIAAYILVFVISFLLLSLEQFDLVTTVTAVSACMNNIGPGLEMVGPTGNYSMFSEFSKIILSFDMLAGRLEIFPILLIFSPSLWKKKGAYSSTSAHIPASEKTHIFKNNEWPEE